MYSERGKSKTIETAHFDVAYIYTSTRMIPGYNYIFMKE